MDTKKNAHADDKLLFALLYGSTLEKAAEHAGMSLAAAGRRRKDPAFAQRLQAARDETLVAAASLLGAVATDAVHTLRDLLGAEQPPNVRLQAARSILEFGMHYRDGYDILQRLHKLEAQHTASDATGADELQPDAAGAASRGVDPRGETAHGAASRGVDPRGTADRGDELPDQDRGDKPHGSPDAAEAAPRPRDRSRRGGSRPAPWRNRATAAPGGRTGGRAAPFGNRPARPGDRCASILPPGTSLSPLGRGPGVRGIVTHGCQDRLQQTTKNRERTMTIRPERPSRSPPAFSWIAWHARSMDATGVAVARGQSRS